MERLSRCKCGHEDIEESVGEPFENRHVSILGAHEVSSRSWLHHAPKLQSECGHAAVPWVQWVPSASCQQWSMAHDAVSSVFAKCRFEATTRGPEQVEFSHWTDAIFAAEDTAPAWHHEEMIVSGAWHDALFQPCLPSTVPPYRQCEYEA